MFVQPIRQFPSGTGYLNATPKLEVKAVSNNPDIATILPESRTFTNWWMEDRPVSWTYTIWAKKAGTATFSVETMIPSTVTGASTITKLTSDELKIEVVECAYEVSMRWNDVIINSTATGGAYSSRPYPIGSGRFVKARITMNVQTRQLEGVADVKIHWLRKSRGNPQCDLDGRTQYNTVRITGTISNGILTLTFVPEATPLWFVDADDIRTCFGQFGLPDIDHTWRGSRATFHTSTKSIYERQLWYPRKGPKIIITVKPVRP
jgi:hypothetical protein